MTKTIQEEINFVRNARESFQPPEIKENRIIASANKLSTGLLLIGVRHWDFLMHETVLTLKLGGFTHDEELEEQGFIDRYGKFHNRADAWVIAEKANQIINPEYGLSGNRLCSECLW